ncbi:MAG: PrsW family intramembrane metalloprotease [Candidatus Heimdallarchaeota archaeon]|nr:PrsW family intramembrane metalloprotease [Candidatus Heimdallarchaeota archaeon]MDH5647295.1 PrsW family intramembrane metalloprotease [Candidatus Heimdallarchaeota archaeon]
MTFIEDILMGPYNWIIIFVIIGISTGITILFYYSRDKYEKEPKLQLFVAFFFGIASIFPSLVVSLILMLILPSNDFISAVIIAPLVEEFFKFIMVLALSKDRNFDGPLDGLIYGSMVGAGFAAGENLFYGINALLEGGIGLGVFLATIRSLTQIIGHPFYTGIVGAGIGSYKINQNKHAYNRLPHAIGLHALWNLSSFFLFLFYPILVTIILNIILLRSELKKAVWLDKMAFESGYYENKKKFWDFLDTRTKYIQNNNWLQ